MRVWCRFGTVSGKSVGIQGDFKSNGDVNEPGGAEIS